MSITIKPIEGSFAAEVGAVDLTHRLEDGEIATISDALDQHGVLVFHGQPLTDEQQLELAPRFGPLDTKYPSQLRSDIQQRLKNPEFTDISNLANDGKIAGADDVRRAYMLANQQWHTDTSYKPIPTRVTLLHARVVPPVGANTEYACMRSAYDALPAAMRNKIDGLIGQHSLIYSRRSTGFDAFSDVIRRNYPPARHPLVRTHPRTRRKSLYLSNHLYKILGMPDEEARALIKELIDFATQPRFVYSHKWSVHDLVMWDDSFTLHRATPFEDQKYAREMRRLGVNELHTTVPEEMSLADAFDV